MTQVKLIAAVALACLSISTNAALVDQGNNTLDTETGLRWLDVPLSYNHSYLEVKSSFGQGGVYEGYRYATAAELFELFSHAGVGIGPTNYANAIALITLLGYSSSSPIDFGAYVETQHVTTALLDSEAGPSTERGILGAGERRFTDGTVQTFAFGNYDPVFLSKNFVDPTTGSWLVRSAAGVSEPPSIAVVCLAMLCIGAARKSRLRQPLVGSGDAHLPPD